MSQYSLGLWWHTWTRTRGIMGLNRVEAFFRFMQLPCYIILCEVLLHQSFIFQKICNPTSLQMALVLIPPHKFVRPPYSYYTLQEIEKYDFRVDSNGIKSMPNFIQIRPAVLD